MEEKDRGNQTPFRFHLTLPFIRDDMLYLINPPNNSILHLQSIGQSLVHLGHLGGDAEVDGAVANLDDEAANQVRVDLGVLLDTIRAGK